MTLTVLLLLSAQTSGLPPEVLFLSRATRHVRESMAGVPGYTCMETIDREQFKSRRRARFEGSI